jgi:hypothetical protein
MKSKLINFKCPDCGAKSCEDAEAYKKCHSGFISLRGSCYIGKLQEHEEKVNQAKLSKTYAKSH